MKAQVWVNELKTGDVLADHKVVSTVSQIAGYTIVVFSDKSIKTYADIVSVSLMRETNCIYGGLAAGHSNGHCTADSCI